MAALTNQILFQGLFKAVDLFYNHPDIKDTVVTVKGYGSLYINKKETLRTFKEVMTQLRHMEDDKLVEYLYTNKASRADPFINTLNIPEGTTEEKIPKVFSDKALEEVEKTVKANSANVSGEDKTQKDKELKEWNDKQFGKEPTPQNPPQEEKPEQVQTQTEAQAVENKPSEGEIKFNELPQEQKIAEAPPTESTPPVEKLETPITPPTPITIPEVLPPSVQPATESPGWVERATTHPHTPPVEEVSKEIPPIHLKAQVPPQETPPSGVKPPKPEIPRRTQVPTVPSAFQEREKPKELVPKAPTSPTSETAPSLPVTPLPPPENPPTSLKDKAIVTLKRSAPSIKRFAQDQISFVARTAKSLISRVSFPAMVGGIGGGATLGYFGSSLGPLGVVSGMATGAFLGGFVTDSIVKGQGAFSREPLGYFEIAGGEEGDIPDIPLDEYPAGQIIYTDQGGAQNYQGGGGRSFNPQQISRGFPRLNRHNNLVRQLSSRPGMKIAKQVGAQALRSGIVAAFESNPVGWIITGIVALLILGIALIYLLNNTNKSTAQCPAYMYGSKDCWKQQISDQTPQIPGSDNQNNPNATNLKIGKAGPEAVNNGEEIQYQITITNNDSSPDSFTLVDNIPQGTDYINGSALNDGQYDGSNRVLRWSVPSLDPSKQFIVTFRVKPIKEDFYAVNQAQITNAQTFSTGTGAQGNINPDPKAGVLGCVNCMTAQSINDFMVKGGYTFFYNTGDQFMALANKYKINPAVIIAIGILESHLGNDYRNDPATLAQKNAYGITPNGSTIIPQGSWMNGAEASFQTAAKDIDGKCEGLNCLVGPGKYNSENPNYLRDLTSILATIPQITPTSSEPLANASSSVPSGWPTTGQITQGPFCTGQPSCFSHQNSNAIDMVNNAGTSIYATLDGIANIPNDNPGGYGNYVLITDNTTGDKTIYAHLSSILITNGQQVKKGDLIGKMGSTGFATGPHLHYELSGPLGTQSINFQDYLPSSMQVGRVITNPGPF